MKQLLILSLTAISFLSCTNDDDGFKETSIFGTWKAIEYRVFNDVVPSSTPQWVTLENGHEITFNENMTYFYENSQSCCTETNMCIFEIEIESNDDYNRLSRDYDCNGTIEPVEYSDEYHFNGKYLILNTIYYEEGGRQYKYVRVKKDDDNSSL